MREPINFMSRTIWKNKFVQRFFLKDINYFRFLKLKQFPIIFNSLKMRMYCSGNLEIGFSGKKDILAKFWIWPAKNLPPISYNII